ncbi:uncharacterized protein [Linepithema humile]|uniref:uncharacterized protein n=1 Tax=Linepithema humile TaxID=83485 RepID=UPI00351DF34A
MAAYPDSRAPLSELTRLEIRERVFRIREAYEKFEQIQVEIEALTDNEQEALEYRERLDEEYFLTIAQAESLRMRGMKEVNSDTTRFEAAINETHGVHSQIVNDDNSVNYLPGIAAQSNQGVIYKTTGIRLPTIELPKFSGEAAEWLSFRDTFESLIHKNETITPIQRFHYLKAALEGNALQIIKSLEFTAVNYTVAWKTICNRFNNKRLLAHNHIKAIFNIVSIKEESAAQIREVVDTLSKHLRALNALDQATKHWDALLIYLISTKLDSVTARAWEKERAGSEIPTLDDFKSFLNSRADLLETLELNDKSLTKSKHTDRAKVKLLLIQRQRCIMCNETHKLTTCAKFLELSPQKRVNQVKNAKLCLNCMKPGLFKGLQRRFMQTMLREAQYSTTF